jgi:hypothetical protein
MKLKLIHSQFVKSQINSRGFLVIKKGIVVVANVTKQCRKSGIQDPVLFGPWIWIRDLEEVFFPDPASPNSVVDPDPTNT